MNYMNKRQQSVGRVHTKKLNFLTGTNLHSSLDSIVTLEDKKTSYMPLRLFPGCLIC